MATDQNLMQAGMAGGKAPTMFEMSLPGIFAQQQLDFESGIGNKTQLLQKWFPGLFKPTKKQQKHLDTVKIAAEAQLKRSRANVGAQFAQASGLSPQAVASGAANNKPLQSALEATARGEAGGQEALQGMTTMGPKGQAQQRLNVAQAEAAYMEATGGRYGSGLTAKEFGQKNDIVTSQVQGANSLRGISSMLENLTDAQIVAAGQDTGGALQGEIKGKLFGLFRPMQQLLDSGEMGSVLRESDVKVIEDALGNPDKMMSLLFSREGKTVAMLGEIAKLMDRRASTAMRGLDDRTLGLMAPAFDVEPSRFTTPQGKKKPKAERAFTAPADPGPAGTPEGGGLSTIWQDFLKWEAEPKDFFGLKD